MRDYKRAAEMLEHERARQRIIDRIEHEHGVTVLSLVAPRLPSGTLYVEGSCEQHGRRAHITGYATTIGDRLRSLSVEIAEPTDPFIDLR